MTVALVIPFRDRGTDPLRKANLNHVLAYWKDFGHPVHVLDDGLTGNQQFNRHACYNRAAHTLNADTLAYIESDMLVPYEQMTAAITAAQDHPHLVIPFTVRHELGPTDSHHVRQGADHTTFHGQQVKLKPRRIGAVNVITRQALTLIGQWDEKFTGNWWDDRAMHHAFDICTAPTQWIDGPSWHLHHLPGHTGTHLTPQDRAATEANRRRYALYRQTHNPSRIRQLTLGTR